MKLILIRALNKMLTFINRIYKPKPKYTKEDFNIEFLNSNFDLEGNRKISYRELKQKLNKQKER